MFWLTTESLMKCSNLNNDVTCVLPLLVKLNPIVFTCGEASRSMDDIWPSFFLLPGTFSSEKHLGARKVQGSPLISAMVNSSTLFIVQNWP